MTFDTPPWTTRRAVLVGIVVVATIVASSTFVAMAADGPHADQPTQLDDRLAQQENGPAISLDEVDAPETAEQGETVTWVATVQNLGGEAGTANVSFIVEGVDVVIAEEVVNVTVDAGETEDVEFSATMDVEPAFYGWTISEDFAATSLDGTIEVLDPDPETPTPTPTPEPDETPTPTPEPDDIPGFGALVAVMALSGAALLAYRRYRT